MPKHYTLKPQVTPLPSRSGSEKAPGKASGKPGRALSPSGPGSTSDEPAGDPFIRAEAEDDDGYDPYSDRPPAPEPLFQENPWD